MLSVNLDYAPSMACPEIEKLVERRGEVKIWVTTTTAAAGELCHYDRHNLRLSTPATTTTKAGCIIHDHIVEWTKSHRSSGVEVQNPHSQRAISNVEARLQGVVVGVGAAPSLPLAVEGQAHMPKEYIYELWTAPLSIQTKSKCILGKDYPKPGNPANDLVNITNKNRTSQRLQQLNKSPSLVCIALQLAKECKGNYILHPKHGGWLACVVSKFNLLK
ncbi:hypothetical protein Vadar_012496 [Vaccinium darrowii]|uniref:Uncharacterized protein n=1 Tax=Vaccinium darrowii TaxID=229202 RepID=A0ACB7YDD2_9ERIC|nr:hypothetical protein Vadar_012496 [Vaccinium darrowii]